MGILQSISKGFGLSSKVLAIALIFFVFNFITGLISLPFTGPNQAGNPQAAALSLIIGIISLLIFVFLQGGSLALIRDLIKNNAYSLSDLVANGKKYYVKILGLFIAIIAIVLVAVVIFALLASAILAIANNVFTRALITAVIIIASLAAATLLVFPVYIVVLEDKGPIEALKKGVKVSLDNFWKTLGFFLTVLLIAFVVAFLVGLVVALIAGALPLKVSQIIMLFMNSLLQSYIGIFMMIAFMVFYVGLNKKGSNPGEGPALP